MILKTFFATLFVANILHSKINEISLKHYCIQAISIPYYQHIEFRFRMSLNKCLSHVKLPSLDLINFYVFCVKMRTN